MVSEPSFHSLLIVMARFRLICSDSKDLFLETIHDAKICIFKIFRKDQYFLKSYTGCEVSQNSIQCGKPKTFHSHWVLNVRMACFISSHFTVKR